MKRFIYKGFLVLPNAETGEYDIYTPDEREQPRDMRVVEMSAGSVQDAKDFIDSY